MPRTRIVALISLAMIAFAGNSLLCRLALGHTRIDPATFTAVRIVSGAFVLWLIVRTRGGSGNRGGNWLSACALFVYAAGFSFAYVDLPAATGALLLFGAVQATMIGYALWKGERLRKPQFSGLMLAFGGLVGLLLPGISAPPLRGSLLMLGAGIGWGVYSLRGKGAGDPTGVTAGNFLRAVPIVLVLTICMHDRVTPDAAGFWYALASGGVASGIGYAIWYMVLPLVKAATAASVQLSVPVLAALGGIFFLGEPLTVRLVAASLAILGGIALVILERQQELPRQHGGTLTNRGGEAG
jgi:drug/metabolite transporter (DMT)-like permease